MFSPVPPLPLCGKAASCRWRFGPQGTPYLPACLSDDLYLVDDVFETVSCGPPHACASGMLGSEVWLDDKRLVSNSSTDGLSRKDAKLHGLHINHLTPPSVRFEARGAGARVLTSLLFAVWL